MSYSPAQAVAEAQADVGFHEYGNNGNPYSKWQYGVEYPPGGWCCSAVSKWSYDAGFRFGRDATFGDRGFAYTGALRQWAMRHGIWKPNTFQARPGMLIPMHFDTPDQHVEKVLADSGGSHVATIGGNTSDQVMYRLRPRSVIHGFVALDEMGQTGPGVPPVPPSLPVPPEIPEEDKVFIKPGEQPHRFRPISAKVKNGALFVANTTTNPFFEGTLKKSVYGYTLDMKLPAGATWWGITDRSEDGQLPPDRLIGLALFPNGEVARYDLRWKLEWPGSHD